MNKLTKNLAHLRQKEHKRLRITGATIHRYKDAFDKDLLHRLTEGSCLKCGYLCVDVKDVRCTKDSKDDYILRPIGQFGACDMYYEGDMNLLDGSLKARPWEDE